MEKKGFKDIYRIILLNQSLQWHYINQDFIPYREDSNLDYLSEDKYKGRFYFMD